MKVAIAQINPLVGDVHKNLKTVSENIEKAKKEGARLILFPEVALIGYPPRDLLDYDHLIQENLKALHALEKLSQGIAVVIGFVDPNPTQMGKKYFNAAAVLDKGKCQGIYHKQLLPYYDVFEEERYFEWGKAPFIFEVDGKKVGVTICEDLWNREGFIQRKHFHDPLEGYLGKGLDLILNLSASPFQIGKPERRIQLFQEVAKETGATVLFCNQVGANDELIFDGGSLVVGPNGAVLAKAPVFHASLEIVDLAKSDSKIKSWPAKKSEWIYEALVLGIKDYVHKLGMEKVCLGLSGGIDSAVVAALAVKALGSENVSALCLPTRFSSKETLADAIQIASNLGIANSVQSIEPLFALFEKTLKENSGGKIASLTLENIQPRIRMTLLMAHSNETKSLLLNTSNKSEIATGFATLYGDSSGAISVLGDLTKHQVYELADYVNANQGDVIPRAVLTRVPTAELKENQKDEDVLPPYSELDTLVSEFIEELVDPRSDASIPVESVKQFIRLNASSEYKRRQLPPVLRISSRAFGMGRRIPIVSTKTTELR